jgi:phosphate transport system protein
VRQAVEALVTRNDELAARVKEDDEILDRLEIEIDEASVQLLAKAPLASDLRLILAAMKISQNLERIGDEATKIAKRTRELIQEAPLKQVGQIPALAERAIWMLRTALEAFVNHDPATARGLIPQDKAIDELNREIHRELAAQMVEQPETITRGLNLIVVAKSLERIADHAKNVAEEIVYLCEAQDIRHTLHQP